MLSKNELHMFLFIDVPGKLCLLGVSDLNALSSHFITIAYPFLASLLVISGNTNFVF